MRINDYRAEYATVSDCEHSRWSAAYCFRLKPEKVYYNGRAPFHHLWWRRWRQGSRSAWQSHNLNKLSVSPELTMASAADSP
jgi:hypothetical protein